MTVEHNPSMDQFLGHDLYNQAAVCTTRCDKRIIGSQPQSSFIQRMCATNPGKATPILSLEKFLGLGRTLWSCASGGPHSILGALPSTVYLLSSAIILL